MSIRFVPRRVVDVKRRLHQAPQFHLEPAALVLIQIAGAKLLLIDAAPRRRSYGSAADSFDISSEKTATVCGSCALRRDVVRDVQGERRLAHGGTRGEDDQFAFVHAGGHLIELVEARADSLDALAGIEKDVDAAFVIRRGSAAVLRSVCVERLSPSFSSVSSAPARMSSGSSCREGSGRSVSATRKRCAAGPICP